jgi:hypothetical protein
LAQNGKPAKSDPDVVSRVVAIISLLVSAGSLAVAGAALYYSSIERRYLAHIAYGQARLSLSVGANTAINVQDQTLTFANGGNQPVAIQRLGYLVKGVRAEPDGKSCPNDDAPDAAPVTPAPLAATISRLYGLALPSNFVPFGVKAGEIEVKHYDFAGQIPLDQLMPSGPLPDHWNVVACIFIEVYSVGTGAKDVDIPVASDRVQGKENLSQVRLFSAAEGKPFLLIDGQHAL